MFRPNQKQEPLSTNEIWICAGVLMLFLGLFAAEIVHDFHPAKLSALFVILFWIPLLVVHEAGHAIVARLLGWHVGRVVIGVGRLVGKFRTGTAVVEIRMIPVEGFCLAVPTNLRFPRLKDACVYLAGPGADLLAAGLVFLLVGPEILFTASTEYVVIAWQSLALAATAQGLVNLFPGAVYSPQGEIANDGLGIIRSFTRPESHYATLIGHTYNEPEDDWQEHDPADSWKRET